MKINFYWTILNDSLFFYLFLLKVIEAADVILEVLDARDPLGCRCPQVEQAVVQSGTNKKIVLVLNKIGKRELLHVHLKTSFCNRYWKTFFFF